MKTGIIILAAGNSSRLGRPKQLLNYRGRTLLDIVSQAAVESGCEPIVVVLGAYASLISVQHHHPHISYIVNKNWEEGMSSSITTGLSALIALAPAMEQVIVAVSDQPFITSDVFNKLIKAQEKYGKNIVSSNYAQTLGTPVLFNKKYFDQLLSLRGNHGAKQLLENHQEDTASILFELGKIDIDTEIDYNKLIP